MAPFLGTPEEVDEIFRRDIFLYVVARGENVASSWRKGSEAGLYFVLDVDKRSWHRLLHINGTLEGYALTELTLELEHIHIGG